MGATLTFFFKIIYFWLPWVFVASRGLSLVAACAGFSLRWLLLLRSTGCRRGGFSSCGSRALERRLSSCGARGLAAPRHVGSSRTRARTRVPCIGRRILNHCATREVPTLTFLLHTLSFECHGSPVMMKLQFGGT